MLLCCRFTLVWEVFVSHLFDCVLFWDGFFEIFIQSSQFGFCCWVNWCFGGLSYSVCGSIVWWLMGVTRHEKVSSWSASSVFFLIGRRCRCVIPGSCRWLNRWQLRRGVLLHNLEISLPILWYFMLYFLVALLWILVLIALCNQILLRNIGSYMSLLGWTFSIFSQ